MNESSFEQDGEGPPSSSEMTRGLGGLSGIRSKLSTGLEGRSVVGGISRTGAVTSTGLEGFCMTGLAVASTWEAGGGSSEKKIAYEIRIT